MDALEDLRTTLPAAREAAHAATYLASTIAKLPGAPFDVETRVVAANRAARAVFALDDAMKDGAPEEAQALLARDALHAAVLALELARDALHPSTQSVLLAP